MSQDARCGDMTENKRAVERAMMVQTRASTSINNPVALFIAVFKKADDSGNSRKNAHCNAA